MAHICGWGIYHLREWSQSPPSFIVSLQGDEVKLAMKLEIKTSNNETEYEALLIGLRVARNLGATWIVVHSDSQLMTR